MSFTKFNESTDIITTKIDSSNPAFTISTSAVAALSSLWAFVANSTTAGFLFKPDTTSLSTSNVSTSAAFRHLANFFFGTSTYILDPSDNSTQRTSLRCIQVGRPLLDEGLYPGTISAAISSTNFTITAVDRVDNSSINSPLGLTGRMVDSVATGSYLGTVFYDHGVIVFHGGASTTGTILASSSSGFGISAGYNQPTINLVSFRASTRNVVKRSIFFCRAFNKDYNFTTNPTARTSDGFLISALTANPTTFITTIGLYDDNGNLLAVGKVNPPQKKDQYSERLFQARLDF